MTDPWWKADDSRKRASDAVGAARGIRDRQSQRRAWLTLAYALYGDLDAFDLSPTGYGVERTASEVQTVLNVVRACADTVRAELIQSRPRPMFMPSGADFAVRKKCGQLGRFIEGLYTDEAFDRTASEVAIPGASSSCCARCKGKKTMRWFSSGLPSCNKPEMQYLPAAVVAW